MLYDKQQNSERTRESVEQIIDNYDTDGLIKERIKLLEKEVKILEDRVKYVESFKSDNGLVTISILTSHVSVTPKEAKTIFNIVIRSLKYQIIKLKKQENNG